MLPSEAGIEAEGAQARVKQESQATTYPHRLALLFIIERRPVIV